MIAPLERRRIYIFLAISYAASILLALLVFLTGGMFPKIPGVMKPSALLLMALLMTMPALANVVTRLLTREGWSNTLLRPNFRRSWPWYVVGWTAPFLAIIVGGGIYYLIFPGQFDPSMTYVRETFGMESPEETTLWTPIISRLVTAVIATIPTLPLMFGEEFGWRAYLLPKLMPLGGRKVVLLIGVIHGAWHWPFFLMGYNYGFTQLGLPIVAAALLYLVVVTFFSALFAWVTLRSGTVWPAALAHGTINNTVDVMVNYLRSAPNTLVGPTPLGVIGMLGFALLAVPIFLSRSALAPMVAPPPARPKPVAAAAPA